MSRSRKVHLDRWIGERKYGIYAGLMIASAIAMIASQGRTSMNTVEPAMNTAKPADRVYGNCAHARAQGAAPIMRGEPGYRAALDRDNDGVACEPWQSTENRQ